MCSSKRGRAERGCRPDSLSPDRGHRAGADPAEYFAGQHVLRPAVLPDLGHLYRLDGGTLMNRLETRLDPRPEVVVDDPQLRHSSTVIATYDRLTAQLAEELRKEQVAELMGEGALWSEDHAIEVATSI